MIANAGPNLVIVNAEIDAAIQFVDDIQSRRLKLIALIDSDPMRDILRAKSVSIVDKRGSLTALSDSIRLAVEHDFQLDMDRDHVMIVDDEESIRQILSDFLERRGYATITAANGVEALEIFDRDPRIAAILLDVTMPQKGGMETLVDLMKRSPQPGVVMLTAIADRQIAQHAMQLGAFSYITKPPDLNEVESAISACIGRFQRQRKKTGNR